MTPPSPILVDLGSSTVKVYRLSDGKASLLAARSIKFKDGFTPDAGITAANLRALREFLVEASGEQSMHIYATALFRKFTDQARRALATSLEELGATFEIVSQENESRYLEVALAERYDGETTAVLINAGGGSTELITHAAGQRITDANLDLGVGTVLGEYPSLAEERATVTLYEVVAKLRERISPPAKQTPLGILSGGELTYMRVTGYPLEPNGYFEDPDHPSALSLQSMAARNKEVVEQMAMSELESLMPENPGWMHGARAFVCLAQAICEIYGVTTVVPSDQNMIDGIVREKVG